MALRRTRGFDVCDYDGVALSYDPVGQYQNTQGQMIGSPVTPGDAWWIFNTGFGEADYVDVFDSQQIWIVGFHFALANEGAGVGTPVVEFLRIGNAAGSVLSLRINADQTLSICLGTNCLSGGGMLTEVKRTFLPLSISAYQYLELKVKFGSGGSYELRFNGSPVMAAPDGTTDMIDPNINLVSAVGPLPDRITQRFENLGTRGHVYDNQYVCDGDTDDPTNPYADFLGPCRVITLLPTADQLKQWTPKIPGDLFPMVDEVSGTHPDGDGTYIFPPAVSVEATWKMNSCPCVGLIFGLSINMCAKPLSGSPHVGALFQSSAAPQLLLPEPTLIDSGSNLGQGEPEVFGYRTYQVVSTQNPDTLGPWQAGDVNAAFWGVGSDNFTTQERVTQFYIEVLTSLDPTKKFGCGGPGSYVYNK